MDATDGSPNRNRKLRTLSRLLAFHVSHGPGTTGQRQAELQQQLREMGREQMVFGQRLLELRRALGWTQYMAAVELGISVPMKKIETLRRSVALGSPPRNL